MANSKANVKRTLIDEVLDLKKSKAKQFGILRQAESVPTTQSSSRGASGKGGSVSNASQFLRVDGDSMVGPIGYTRQVIAAADIPNIGNDHTLNIGTTGNYTSHVIWSAGGSDQIDIISGQAITGQHLIIESTETLTQTIRDESNVTGPPAGNIKTLDGNDLVLPTRKTLVWFVYSVVDTFWHQISNPVAAATGGPPFDDNQVIIQNNLFNAKTLTFNLSLVDDPATNLLSWASGPGRTHTFSSTSGTVAQLNLAQSWSAIQTFSPGAIFNGIVNMNSSVDLGNDAGDSISFNGRVDTNILPLSDSAFNLGTASKRWFRVEGVFIRGETITVSGLSALNGDVSLGNNTTDNIAFNGRVGSNVQPNTNLGRTLGAASLRWAFIFTGKIDCNGTSGPAGTFDAGSSTNEAIRINNGGGVIRFDANAIALSASAGFVTLPSQPLGFVNIKIGGANRRIPFYGT